MEIIFHSYANETHFGCVPSLILKERVFGIVFKLGSGLLGVA